MACYPCEKPDSAGESVIETASVSLFSVAASTCAVSSAFSGMRRELITGFKHVGQKAVCFHVLNLRSALKESPWRMGGIFCSCRRGDRYSLVRGRCKNPCVVVLPMAGGGSTEWH